MGDDQSHAGEDLKKDSNSRLDFALSSDFSIPDKIGIFGKLDLFLLRNPSVSTWLVAVGLASIWLLTWLLVLFFVTFSSKSPTSAYVFIAGLLLSTVAEAVIRLSENSWILERWSRGVLHREIDGMGITQAIAWVLGGLLVVILLPESTNIIDLCFELDRNPEDQKLFSMFSSWWSEFRDFPTMFLYIVSIWVMRIIIYKRKANSVTWKETELHLQRLEEVREASQNGRNDLDKESEK